MQQNNEEEKAGQRGRLLKSAREFSYCLISAGCSPKGQTPQVLMDSGDESKGGKKKLTGHRQWSAQSYWNSVSQSGKTALNTSIIQLRP